MIERKIYHDGLLVITRCSGKVTTDELIKSEYWMVNNFGEKIKPEFSQIFDALEADTEAVTEDDIRRVAQINLNHGEERGSFSMAILAVKPYPMALARLHKLLSAAANINVEIFSDIDTA
ncbi:MAG: hypothetical protein KAT12_05065, partial [Gammaproteobacteria bacterium]|nr:hypothetical protein [Gammaproteobacteria bacterium]